MTHASNIKKIFSDVNSPLNTIKGEEIYIFWACDI